MDEAFTFLDSEKETELDAAGNTMAVDKYKGVIRYDSPKTRTVTNKEKERIIFLFLNKNDNNRSLSSFKLRFGFSIRIFSGYENRTYNCNKNCISKKLFDSLRGKI